MSLIEQTLFGTIDKVQMAIDRIKTFEPPEGYYVAFSGGKDSVVVLDLVKRSGVKFDAHYNITGIDPPELFYFIRDNFPEVQRHRPEITIWSLIVKKMMPPTRIVRYCCEHLKERGGKDRFVVTGVRWAESNKRRKRKVTESCFRDSRKHYLNPIIDWSDDDVWQYIHDKKIQYCALYDEGFKRLGCIGCPMANKGRIKEFQRWPRFERKYRTAFAAAAAARLRSGNFYGTSLKIGDLIPTGEYDEEDDEIYREATQEDVEFAEKHKRKLRWKDGDTMFDWWMQDDRATGDPDQTVMFE